jgi:hypothetical protein
VNEVGSQRGSSTTNSEERFYRFLKPTDHSTRSVSDVSNCPFPNRTGPFQGIRLSRRSALSIGASCPLRYSFRSLSASPWTPSPCIRHYPDRLSTMGPLSPSSARFLGDPVVPLMPWPVRRYPFGGSPTHCGRLPGGTLNRPSNLNGLTGNMRISCCCKSHGTKPTHLGFGKPILTLDSLAARPLGRAVSSAPYFSTLLLSPRPFRVEVRLCFNHSGSSGIALPRL